MTTTFKLSGTISLNRDIQIYDIQYTHWNGQHQNIRHQDLWIDCDDKYSVWILCYLSMYVVWLICMLCCIVVYYSYIVCLTMSSLWCAFLNAFVHLIFRGFRFILKLRWHLLRQKRKIYLNIIAPIWKISDIYTHMYINIDIHIRRTYRQILHKITYIAI